MSTRCFRALARGDPREYDRAGPRLLGHAAQLERWIPYYEAKGYRVIAPAYPGFEVEALDAEEIADNAFSGSGTRHESAARG